jgi:hypothetical protein
MGVKDGDGQACHCLLFSKSEDVDVASIHMDLLSIHMDEPSIQIGRAFVQVKAPMNGLWANHPSKGSHIEQQFLSRVLTVIHPPP